MQSQYGMNSKAQQIHHMYIQYKFYIIFSHFFVTLTSAHMRSVFCPWNIRLKNQPHKGCPRKWMLHYLYATALNLWYSNTVTQSSFVFLNSWLSYGAL